MSTKTTNLGLVKPALTDAPPDITVLNKNWDILDSRLSSITVEATLLTGEWSSEDYVWENASIKSATQTIELLPSKDITADQLQALQGANIVGTSQAVGKVTLTAFGQVPTIDIPVVFIIRGDV